MGILDNIIGGVTNRVASDAEYRASSWISNAITGGAQKALEGDKSPKCLKM